MKRRLGAALLCVALSALMAGATQAHDVPASARSAKSSGSRSALVGQRSPRFPPTRVIILNPYGRYPYAPLHHGHAAVTPDLYPFFCFFEGIAFVNQAGFLDHVAGTHKIPLDRARDFCTDTGTSCRLGY